MSETRREGASAGSRRGEGFELLVQVGQVETWYRRAGAGRPVLLLSRGDRDVRGARFLRLAETYLVIEPRAVPDRPGWYEWVAGVVEGLGLRRPLLAVDRVDLDEAERFALDDPDRVGGVLLLEGIDA